MECQLALKEWNVVCEAIRQGRQMVLARKGGISEPEGEFQLPRTRFWLFPTYFHEAPARLNDAGRAIISQMPLLTAAPASEEVRLDLICEVAVAIYIESVEKLSAALAEQVLNREALEQRFYYRHPGLHLLIIRAYEAAEPALLRPTTTMQGCKSWVELDEPLPAVRKLAVIPDGEFERRKKILLSALDERT